MALFYNPIISAEPVFIVRPSSQRVGLNGIAKFDCVAQGNPPPSVFWAKEVKKSILLYILYLKFYKSCCCNSALEYPISNMIVKMSKWPNDTSLGVPTAYSAVVGSVRVSRCHIEQISPIKIHRLETGQLEIT